MAKQPKPKKCAWSKCRKMFTPSPFRFNQKTCDNMMCALGYVKDKEEEKEAKEWKVKRKGMVERLKTLSDYEKEAKEVFQLFIRMRDKDLPCIACGTHRSQIWDAGHYFPAGQYSGLIFEESNVHKSCRACNCFHHGNLINYRFGLVNRYGLRYVEKLEELSVVSRNYKYTRDELIEIREYYKQKVKDLKDINNSQVNNFNTN